MKIKAMVVNDEVIEKPATKDYPASKTRHLVLIDQDDTPLVSTITLVVPVDDPVLESSKVPNLMGHVIMGNIREWAQYDSSKKHVCKGTVAEILGVMRFDSAKANTKAQ